MSQEERAMQSSNLLVSMKPLKFFHTETAAVSVMTAEDLKRKCVEETFLDAKCFQCDDENKCHIDEDTFPSESCKSHKRINLFAVVEFCICEMFMSQN